MPEYLKNINFQELKDNYMDNHGFVLTSDLIVRESNIEKLAISIINKGITKDLPLLVSQNGNSTIFVYDQKTEFDSVQFFCYADDFNKLGIGVVSPLRFFLKQIN
jgi:hypothetical protein